MRAPIARLLRVVNQRAAESKPVDAKEMREYRNRALRYTPGSQVLPACFRAPMTPSRLFRVNSSRDASRSRHYRLLSCWWVCTMRALALEVRAQLRGGPVENDLTYIALTIVFFVLAGLLTIACDKIIGPDPVEVPVEDGVEQEQVAA